MGGELYYGISVYSIPSRESTASRIYMEKSVVRVLHVLTGLVGTLSRRLRALVDCKKSCIRVERDSTIIQHQHLLVLNRRHNLLEEWSFSMRNRRSGAKK